LNVTGNNGTRNGSDRIAEIYARLEGLDVIVRDELPKELARIKARITRLEQRLDDAGLPARPKSPLPVRSI